MYCAFDPSKRYDNLHSLVTTTVVSVVLISPNSAFSFDRGDYEDGKWNEEYWKLKEEFVGVVAPVERTEADLDPPTIFHIAQDFDMIRSLKVMKRSLGITLLALSLLRAGVAPLYAAAAGYVYFSSDGAVHNSMDSTV